MSTEREIYRLSAEERLNIYIEYGIRDALEQPDAPALTLTKNGSVNLLKSAFSVIGEQFVEDLNIQASVFSKYVASRVRRGSFVEYKVFKDKRTEDEGFHIFIKSAKETIKLSETVSVQHPDKDLIQELRINQAELAHIYGDSFIGSIIKRVDKHCEVCTTCMKMEREVVKFY